MIIAVIGCIFITTGVLVKYDLTPLSSGWLFVIATGLSVVFLLASLMSAKTTTEESPSPPPTPPTQPQTGDGETTTETNWGTIAITILLLAVIGGGGWWAFSTHSSGGLSPEERELVSLGWKKVIVSPPDKDGFSSVVIPTEAVGKKFVEFRSCQYTQTRSNGVRSKIWAPRSTMSWATSTIEVSFVDVKFTKVPASGFCWAQFR